MLKKIRMVQNKIPGRADMEMQNFIFHVEVPIEI